MGLADRLERVSSVTHSYAILLTDVTKTYFSLWTRVKTVRVEKRTLKNAFYLLQHYINKRGGIILITRPSGCKLYPIWEQLKRGAFCQRLIYLLKAVKRIDTVAVTSVSPLNTQMITGQEQTYTQVDNKKIRRTFLFSKNR